MRITPRFERDFEVVILTESSAVKLSSSSINERGMLGIMYAPATVTRQGLYMAPHRMAFFQSENFFGGVE